MLNIKVFSGSSHPELAELICGKIGITPGKITTGKFANHETKVEIGVRFLLLFVVGFKMWVI